MTLIERLLAQANKEANEMADLLDEAANALKRQEPEWWPAVEKILDEYGLQAIEFVADFKSAMEQPQQKPVAIVVAREYEDGSPAGHCLEWRGRNEADDFPAGTKFYTSPPARKPLTDEEISKVCVDVHLKRDFSTNLEKFVAIARAIEAAHEIKP